jgi:hypothetical protein
MKGKHKPRKKQISVEDHGNGYMVVGIESYRKAAQVLCDYVDNPEDYRFACPTFYNGRPAVWLADTPGAVWEGAAEPSGKPISR